ITNSGNSPSGNISFSTPVPAGMTLDPASIVVTGGTDTTVGSTVTATLNPVAASGTATVYFEATVNATVTKGTAFAVTSTINHSIVSVPRTASDTENLTVSGTAVVTLSAPATTQTASPGDSGLFYQLDITNGATIADIFDLTYVSPSGWTYVFNTANTCNPANDITSVNLAAGATTSVYLCFSTPAAAADTSSDIVTATARSRFDISVFDDQNFTTTIAAPVILTVTKNAPAAANPNDVITYTVSFTNTGTGNAGSIIISDAIPQYTTYQPGTIKYQIGAGPLVTATDSGADADGAALVGGATWPGGSINVGAPYGTISLPAGQSFYLEFQVKVN
ncbi:DUF11 domain-containing protein, partial [bacterium]